MTLLRPLRPVRSYVRRQGRITPSQHRSLATHWNQFVLSLPVEKAFLDWQQIFHREAPRILEIGFGMGDTLVELAKSHPENDYIGIEVHRPGVGHCMQLAQEYG